MKPLLLRGDIIIMKSDGRICRVCRISDKQVFAVDNNYAGPEPVPNDQCLEVTEDNYTFSSRIVSTKSSLKDFYKI